MTTFLFRKCWALLKPTNNLGDSSAAGEVGLWHMFHPQLSRHSMSSTEHPLSLQHQPEFLARFCGAAGARKRTAR